MGRSTRDRLFFCVTGLVLCLCAIAYRPTVYGNSPGEINRYLRWEMADRGTGPVELLAVEDDGPDRFAVFRGEREPDERYIVRFRQNEDGDYEAYGHPKWMYGPYPVRGVYTQPLWGYSGDREVCYAVWNESEQLAEVRFRLDDGPAESVSIPTPPSLTIWRFTGGSTGWHLESGYFDAAGSEL